ncbi:MAG: amidohydrolase family protein [Acidimicrobiia bacterium]
MADRAALEERFAGMRDRTVRLGERPKPATGGVTFLPEPGRQPRHWPIISTDDHVVEPAHLFEGRVPRHLADRAPRVVETEDGNQQWVFDGRPQASLGLAAVVGRPLEEAFEPTRFDHMRRGAWDPAHRVRDMDLNGIYASLNFPSGLGGFAGQRLQLGVDEDLALAVVRAWNDWYLEEWVQAHPGRFVGSQLAWLRDPVQAGEEVRRNAERGVRAVAFTEGPAQLGLPGLHGDHWDPFLRACEETGTVVCLHVGSASTPPEPSPGAPFETVGVLFAAHALFYAVDWLFSGIPVRFPDLRICMSEGGIGWVASLLDRLDHMQRYQVIYGTWPSAEVTPAEALRRNFYFCAINDPTAFRTLDRIGEDHVTVESDYPHLDSLWPHTQAVLHDQLAHLPAEVAAKVAWRNASELFGHEVPTQFVEDPDAF